MGVIFIAGVFAVGKTTLCKQAEETLGIPHYSASGLIKAEKSSAISSQGKAVHDVADNQQLLIRGIQKARARHEGNILLDGHFSLPTTDGRIELVEIEVFRALGLLRAIILSDEPEAIASRWQGRDGQTNKVESIHAHQEIELRHAHDVTQVLAIPLIQIQAFDRKTFLDSLA